MWFEVLPSLGIIIACLHMPQIVAYVNNRLFLGTPYRRALLTYNDSHHYLRDMRISEVNDPYIQKNLDCLVEDKEEPQKEEKKVECL